jgi:hypothetical protein
MNTLTATLLRAASALRLLVERYERGLLVAALAVLLGGSAIAVSRLPQERATGTKHAVS